jgi:uncharacterized protein YndB with AHSA1/START domain
MTRQRSFKLLVRARMDKTGESYTAARAVLLAARPTTVDDSGKPVLATSDDRIRERTGRGWEEWFDALDEWGAADLTHREIARKVAAELGVDPLAWNAQAVTGSYERVRRGRAVGEHPDGFSVSVSRTVAATPDALLAAFTEESVREQWFPGAPVTARSSTTPNRAHFDWDGDGSRLHVTIMEKDESRTTVVVEHARLADAGARDRAKAAWRERLGALKAYAEGGPA